MTPDVANQLTLLKSKLRKYSSKEKALFLPKFFKTGVGEYGEGDKFLGVSVPHCRLIAKKNKDLSISEVGKLLASPFHEERLTALLILVETFKKSDKEGKEKIFNFYLNNTKRVNNWDLVDLSCHKIIGAYIRENPKYAVKYNGKTYIGSQILSELAHSSNLWERRISIISNFTDIKYKNYDKALLIAEILLKDEHDLIHKAVGWVLREIGKNDRGVEECFLNKHYKQMPRTMLRYAIEKFPENLRMRYLKNYK